MAERLARRPQHGHPTHETGDGHFPKEFCQPKRVSEVGFGVFTVIWRLAEVEFARSASLLPQNLFAAPGHTGSGPRRRDGPG